MANRPLRPPASALRSLLESEAASGIVLIAAAAIALVLANSNLASAYSGALETRVGPLSALHWINDALMALFFLLIGLEIKRALVTSELRSWSRRLLIASSYWVCLPSSGHRSRYHPKSFSWLLRSSNIARA